MPELPEVETVVRGLRETVVGETIQIVRVNAPAASIVVGQSLHPKTFVESLEGRAIQSVARRGKNILISLSGGLTLWVHLKMTGHFTLRSLIEPLEKHDLVVFDFTSSPKSGTHLRFNDYRRFGRLRLFSSSEILEQPGLKELGPEPLEFGAQDFVTLCRSRSRMLKAALLDQSFIAGVGNIYADEALYASRLHPQRLTNSISTKKLTELHSHIQRLLRRAIAKMGSSVDSYSGVNGQVGQYQKYLKAYNNEGKPCGRCRTKIIREKIGARSAHFCPRCQAAK
ncbi:MAG: DNA-formamidopyrimidine glycosylase [candidate division Zixibacteria bacterium]|nr:DNA-formamidopyrimidine glycosylase [candidate division Zixibacteria bacterium]